MKVDFFTGEHLIKISGGYIYNDHILQYLKERNIDISYNRVGSLYDSQAELIIVDGIVLEKYKYPLAHTHKKVVLLFHAIPKMGQDILKTILERHRIVVTGEETARFLINTYNILEENIYLLQPGIPSGWVKKQQYPNLPRNLLCISNYVKGKGHFRILDVFAGLSDLQWQLSIYGNPYLDQDYFRQLVYYHQLSPIKDRVHIHGVVPHQKINQLLVAADLLLLFSEQETFSMITAEAIYAGLPVISTRVGAAEIFDRSGIVNYLPEDLDTGDVQRSIRFLLSEKGQYEQLTQGHTPISLPLWEQVAAAFYNYILNEVSANRPIWKA